MKVKEPNPYNFDDYRQQVPQFYYKRFKIELGVLQIGLPHSQIWSFKLTQGYTYLLRNYAAKWTQYHEGSPERFFPIPKISFFNKIRATNYQAEPIPPQYMTTPGGQDVWSATAHAAVDQDAFGVVLTVAPLKNILTQNYFYQYNDNVFVQLDLPASPEEIEDFYFDLVLFGYLIPQKDLGMWG